MIESAARPSGGPGAARDRTLSPLTGCALAAGIVGLALSDDVGRRPVLLVALTALIGATARQPCERRRQRGVGLGVRVSAALVELLPAPRVLPFVALLVQSWSILGLFLSLGPQLSAELFHTANHLLAGAGVFALAGAAAVAQLVLGRTPPWAGAAGGSLALSAGWCCWSSRRWSNRASSTSPARSSAAGASAWRSWARCAPCRRSSPPSAARP